MQEIRFSPVPTLRVGQRLIRLLPPKVMGIINATPDSFYAGSRVLSVDKALEQVEQMLAEGASFIDVGGYSTRPGAQEVPLEEELRRVVPIVSAIAKRFPEAIISIDTFRASVARAAIQEGAHMINDVSGGQADEQIFAVAGQLKVPYVLMHLRGNPQTMQQLTHYQNIFTELMNFFQQRILQLHAAGCHDIVLDPGFGFAKTVEQNYTLLKNLAVFSNLGKPILVGLSRKSMIWKKLGNSPQEALNGTTVLNTMAILQGAHILRVHDVRPAVEIISLLSNG
ncbi:MAG: dihydropteroate synthase [Cytophagales bacterium]|nr:dihydropteroate synthase [Bernardetiaceae bacterium]MDW8210034.1 dihydropteroate synthase [Cytophagales bacterium]